MVEGKPRNISVKLFQNLYTGLAEEVVKSLFLFLALAAILFNVAESFEQFWLRVTQETFLYNYFKIDLLVQEKKSIKVFSIFSSGGHLVQWSGTVSAILVDSHLRNIPVKLFQNLSTDLDKSIFWFRRRSRLKVFLFLVLAAILFNRAEWFV